MILRILLSSVLVSFTGNIFSQLFPSPFFSPPLTSTAVIIKSVTRKRDAEMLAGSETEL